MQSTPVIQILRSFKSILLLLVVCITLAACSKPDEITPEQQVTQYLTGLGNRYWRIKELYVNNVKTVLTTAQLDYYKTYTINAVGERYSGTFTDANNFIGNWILKGKDHIMETITNAVVGSVPLDLTINLIDANNMDVQYTSNGQTVRTVYFAY